MNESTSTKEYLKPVSGKLATAQEIGIAESELSRLKTGLDQNLTPMDLAILRFLGTRPIPGLPLTSASQSEYLHQHSLLIDNSSSSTVSSAIIAVEARHLSQRGVTRSGYGWVKDGEIFTEESLKGVGITSQATDIRRRSFHPGSISGFQTQVDKDILASLKARVTAMSLPLILPPIKLLKLPWRLSYQETLSAFVLPRAWAIDERVTALYSATHQYFHDEDAARIIADPETMSLQSRKIVSRFLYLVRAVDAFNFRNSTNYRIGCSQHFPYSDFSFKGYCEASRSSLCENVAEMINHCLWHMNLSPQQVGIAIQLGDWDSFAYTEAGSKIIWADDSRFIDDASPRKESRMTLSVLLNAYKISSLVTALCEGEIEPLEKFWARVTRKINERHVLKSSQVFDLVNLASSSRQKPAIVIQGMKETETMFQKIANSVFQTLKN